MFIYIQSQMLVKVKDMGGLKKSKVYKLLKHQWHVEFTGRIKSNIEQGDQYVSLWDNPLLVVQIMGCLYLIWRLYYLTAF